MKIISIVIPVYNEIDTLPIFFKRLFPVIKTNKNYDFEIIVVNDGSSDGSLRFITDLKNDHKNLVIIDLSRNFGKEAALTERENGAARRLVAFEVVAIDADVVAYEPVWIDGVVVGFCTSGGYSHYADKSIALALIPAERAKPGLTAEIEILGQMCAAHLLESPLLKT